jgi:hypothetical protein
VACAGHAPREIVCPRPLGDVEGVLAASRAAARVLDVQVRPKCTTVVRPEELDDVKRAA